MERRYDNVLSNQSSIREEMEQSIVFIPYNKKWGKTTVTGCVPAVVNESGKAITSLDIATSYLKHAIIDCLGDVVLTTNGVKYITFDVEYSEEYGCDIIDKASFQIFNGYPQQLGKLKATNVFLEMENFISPDDQMWVSEDSYKRYATSGSFIYECSDGTLTTSYDDFKKWEMELAVRPNNPNYSVLPYTTSLDEVGHLISSTDGTIWRDGNLLNEYMSWRRDHNHNYENGYYHGEYGIANSFAEYMKINNASYFAQHRVKRSEQHMDKNHGLLFISKEAQQKYKSTTKQVQKIK